MALYRHTEREKHFENRISKPNTKEKEKNMKPLKSAEQKNVQIDMSFYDSDYVKQIDGVFELKDVDPEANDNDFRLSLDYVKDLKVVYDKGYGGYLTRAITKTGKTLYVIL